MTNVEARFNNSLRPRKPEGSLGRTAQDGHLDSHTAPELCRKRFCYDHLYGHYGQRAARIGPDRIKIMPDPTSGIQFGSVLAKEP